jgi:type IV secretory pathway TraG/TraD family ATPase VirD4
MIKALREFVGVKPRSYTLSVPRIEENEGLLLLGDPGTGKSQVIHQLLDNIAKRKPEEAVVVYDPAGEFIEKHFNPDSDIVLNPLDARCPFWMPGYDILGVDAEVSAPERQFMAESFFPYPEHLSPNTQFFVKAARSIFAQMLTFNPTPERLVEMLADEELIDHCVTGTEHAHLIGSDAKGQRGGVLATLSEIGESFKLLPTSEERPKNWLSFSKWARRRQGWIFITSTHSTREALRRLHAAWINILLGNLLGSSYSVSGQRPCWMMIDEVHSLKHLPILKSTLVEARKYGVKMVLGTQNKSQFEEHYGRGAATMLASSHTKILFRCNEPESARWVSEMIGEEEKERPRVGTTATVQANGRDSINYSTFTERRLVVSKEQIMALPNLHGYWRYADSVVPFRIEPIDRPQVAPSFIQRARQPVIQKEVKEQARKLVAGASICKGSGNGNHAAEITSEMIDGIDIGF